MKQEEYDRWRDEFLQAFLERTKGNGRTILWIACLLLLFLLSLYSYHQEVMSAPADPVGIDTITFKY